MNHELIATSSKWTRLMKEFVLAHGWKRWLLTRWMSLCSWDLALGAEVNGGRWKDSMKHDLAARICLLLNHSLYLQPEAPVTQFTLRALNFVPILRLKAMTGNKLFKKLLNPLSNRMPLSTWYWLLLKSSSVLICKF